MKNFILIGVGGYIAPKHLEAIKRTGNTLLASMDIHDSVGVLDSYFPSSAFFREFERFDRYVELLKRKGAPVDYLSVCTPNYLHDAHCRFGLRAGADVICEKPLVLNPWNAEALAKMEMETGRHIYTILQLRLHPAVVRLKEMSDLQKGKRFRVNLKYITARGEWYHYTWKGSEAKSGGLISNIGIHFFDMLIWVFGAVKRFGIKQRSDKTVAGYLELANADVEWLLSIDEKNLPAKYALKGLRTCRTLLIDGTEVNFSEGFEKLHIDSYKEIIAGKGFSVQENMPVIELIHSMRNS